MMQKEFVDVLKNGRIIKTNTFVTERGIYTIHIRTYQGKLYFFKYKNMKLVECIDLFEL